MMTAQKFFALKVVERRQLDAFLKSLTAPGQIPSRLVASAN
jgi:hypothetical protein